MERRDLRSLVPVRLLALLALAACSPKAPAASVPLRIGVTLHAYDSWCRQIVSGIPGAECVPLLPADLDVTHAPPASPGGAEIAGLDVLVMNGVGQDDFVAGQVKASGNTRLVVITANEATTPVKSTTGEQPNPYTYVSFGHAIEQTRLIASKLGELRPDLADRLGKNAAAYGERLRALREAALVRLAGAKGKRVVTVGDAFGYLLADLGIEVAGVVEPAQADAARQQGLPVVGEATLSTMATGPYAADAFEKTMQKNADALVEALR